MKTCDTCGHFQTSKVYTCMMAVDGECFNSESEYFQRYMGGNEGCDNHSDNE